MLLALVMAVAIDGEAPEPLLVTEPQWKPVGSEASPLRYYPEVALKSGVEGRAKIRCIVGLDGRLEACEVLNEAPEGYAFGAAAIRMSELFHMKLLDKQGKSTPGGIVEVPIRFQLPH
jgi:TonB family protein